MRMLLLLSFCIALSFFAYGQTCLSGGISFNSQQQIDDFAADYAGCTTILGNVTINDTSPNVITNLAGLAQLEQIDGNLNILFNPSLPNLNGLENLQSVGGFLGVSVNASLENIDGFTNLTTIGSFIQMFNNGSLTSITGFSNVTSIGGFLDISNHTMLSSLEGIHNIDPLTINSTGSSPDIELRDNPLLSVCNVQSICEALLLPSTTTGIQDNASGCNSETEIEMACTTLPVTWHTRLKAMLSNRIVVLSWSIASAENNRGFIIEWSTNGREFKELDFIEDQSSYLLDVDYSFQHESPINGENYYRVKQVDYDDSSSYSNTAQITIDSKILALWPNPFNAKIMIEAERSDVVEIINAQGQVVTQFNLPKGRTSVDVSMLPPGIYYLKNSRGDIEKLVKH